MRNVNPQKLQRKLAQKVLQQSKQPGVRTSREGGLTDDTAGTAADGSPASSVPRLPRLPESREQPLTGEQSGALQQQKMGQRHNRRRDQLLGSSMDASTGNMPMAKRKDDRCDAMLLLWRT